MVINMVAGMEGSSNIKCEIFQAKSMRDAAFGCDWVGTAIPFQRCLMFIIATASKEFQLTAGKFVPVSNLTTLNVCMYLYTHVCLSEYVCVDVCMYVCVYVCMYVCTVCVVVCTYVCMHSCVYICMH